MKHYRES